MEDSTPLKKYNLAKYNAVPRRRYKNTKTGKRFPEDPVGIVGFNSWWSRWSVASFCEHLIREGYNLVRAK